MADLTPSKRDEFWILARSAAYLRGRGVTFGPPLIQGSAINPGVYSIPVSLMKVPGVAAMDLNLGIFADNSLDHVLMTPAVGALTDPRAFLTEATRKLKVGGHLVFVMSLDQPIQSDVTPRELLASLSHWREKDEWSEGGKWLLVLKKEPGRRGIEPQAVRTGKRACIARYGALGDAIIMTPLVRHLHESGYHVTLNISGYCAPVFENSPFVDNLIVQEKDLIPNHLLGRYWRYWEAHYDKYINLSESLEGDLLIVENRAPFFTTKKWRNERGSANYYDYTLVRAGFPEVTGKRGELFFTNAEERRATKYFSQFKDQFTVLWALNGSSHHKVYPLLEPTLREWFRSHGDARVITVGDANARNLEFAHYQLIPQAGKWSIRESLIGTKYASCVVGPETMITNAVGCFDTPKIVLLSHSSRENLTKYFTNDYSLEPDQAVAPCYPCNQLHYTKESCPQRVVQDTITGEELGVSPACTLAISPQRLMERLDEVYDQWRGQRSARTDAATV